MDVLRHWLLLVDVCVFVSIYIHVRIWPALFTMRRDAIGRPADRYRKETARVKSLLFWKLTSDSECLHEVAVQMDAGGAPCENGQLYGYRLPINDPCVLLSHAIYHSFMNFALESERV
jgi:hypothetical protein